jgi:hypothetical protein
MKFQAASHTAIGTDGFGYFLLRRSPVFGITKIELSFKLECVSGTHSDTVPAINTRRFGQWYFIFSRDPSIEAAASDSDSKSVLGIISARLNALVAKNALVVGANEEIIFNLNLVFNFCWGFVSLRVNVVHL